MNLALFPKSALGQSANLVGSEVMQKARSIELNEQNAKPQWACQINVKKGKAEVCFYFEQYPFRWTAQSALNFTTWQTC